MVVDVKPRLRRRNTPRPTRVFRILLKGRLEALLRRMESKRKGREMLEECDRKAAPVRLKHCKAFEGLRNELERNEAFLRKESQRKKEVKKEGALKKNIELNKKVEVRVEAEVVKELDVIVNVDMSDEVGVKTKALLVKRIALADDIGIKDIATVPTKVDVSKPAPLNQKSRSCMQRSGEARTSLSRA
ncbi:hypothetical protein BC829DRAFT_293492 [Chytridium lagenaria]|nr:hypothetical protein BC829DRAFT_293492 [Chytridium lagenaria]